MSKYFLLIVSILCATALSNTVYAADYTATYEAISKICNERMSTGIFSIGSDCRGGEARIYYVKNEKVTEAVFNARKKEYEIKGDLCTETKDSGPKELPADLSAKCVIGSYGQYFKSGKSITYREFVDTLLGGVLTEAMQDSQKETLKQLKKDKKVLRSFKSFNAALKSGSSTPYTFANKGYMFVGASCQGNSSILVNGDGYKNLICNEGKVTSLDLYVKNKKVSEAKYLKYIYLREKKDTLATIKILQD